MDAGLFDQVYEISRSLSGGLSGRLRGKAHRYGVKVWLDADVAPRVHFEAQVMRRSNVDGGEGVALEVGLHAELKSEADNEAVLRLLKENEPAWRGLLGAEATLGTFYGADKWRRLSDAWFDFSLEDSEIAMEIASRLVDYVEALEPILTLHDLTR